MNVATKEGIRTRPAYMVNKGRNRMHSSGETNPLSNNVNQYVTMKYGWTLVSLASVAMSIGCLLSIPYIERAVYKVGFALLAVLLFASCLALLSIVKKTTVSNPVFNEPEDI